MKDIVLLEKLPNLSIVLEFKKEDMWVGVYSETFTGQKGIYSDYWVCLIPCFPIHIITYKEKKD